MIFEASHVEGVSLLRQQRNEDERGYFARTWCEEEFARQGIRFRAMQCSVSYSRRIGTVRGLHFAWPPAREGKLVRCQRGRIHDVIVDLRPRSPSFLASYAVELDAAAGDALYVPPGVAHGFQTLADDSEVFYMMSEGYRPDMAGGYRHDDSAFPVRWPLAVTFIDARDAMYCDFDASAHAARFERAAQSET